MGLTPLHISWIVTYYNEVRLTELVVKVNAECLVAVAVYAGQFSVNRPRCLSIEVDCNKTQPAMQFQ